MTRYGRCVVICTGSLDRRRPATTVQIRYTTLAVEADAWAAEINAQRDKGVR